MVDLHTHILPHIDDGAKNRATAVAMLHAEIAQGVKTVVLSPHFYGKRHNPQGFLEKRKEAFERLKPQIPEGIEVRLAAEVHFTGINVPPVDELCKLAIEGTRYILLELPFTQKWTGFLLSTLADFISDADCTPIIAHVERYREVQKNPALVAELIDMGCLIQVNARAFLDKKERGLALALMKKGQVHCLGSDAHDTEQRAPDMLKAYAVIEKAGLKDEWQCAQNSMTEILGGGQVRVDATKPVKKFLGKYL